MWPMKDGDGKILVENKHKSLEEEEIDAWQVLVTQCSC